jgi:hypothetical protein
MTAPSAYVERCGSRWEAWGWDYGTAHTIARADTLRAVWDIAEAAGYRVVEIPLSVRGAR